MKTFTFLISLFCAGATLLTSCGNKSGSPVPALTNCTGCQFLFTENADLASDALFTSGTYRLFWAELKKGVVTQKVYIKAPMQGRSFNLSKADILAHKVLVSDMCIFCNMIAMVPVDGSVKGTNVTPNERADRARWLIEAKIIRSAIDGGGYLKDTVNIRQYFTANFVMN